MSRRIYRNWFAVKGGSDTSTRLARRRRRPPARSRYSVERLEERYLLSAAPIFAHTPLPDPDTLDRLKASVFDSLATGAGGLVEMEEAFTLHSRPGSQNIIFLDFDGHITRGTPWNEGEVPIPNIVTPPYSVDGDGTFTSAELQLIKNIWERVTEDFRPFDVDVTTEDPGTDIIAAQGIRVLIGGSTNDFFSPPADPVGGVALLDSFAGGADVGTFVFSGDAGGNPKFTAEAASHEVGHTFNLLHDGQVIPGEMDPLEYYPGHGPGLGFPTGWGPIMGVSYGQELSQWSKGEYPNANNIADDDLMIISMKAPFRADDYGDTYAAATPLTYTGTSFFGEGFIGKPEDIDFFSFTLGIEEVVLDITPFHNSPNLDILATLYNSAGEVVAESNVLHDLNATFSINVEGGLELQPGNYFISIDGTGKTFTTDPGYSDYGSLGYFSINGSRKSLLEVLVGVDFDVSTSLGGESPRNWRLYSGGVGPAVLSDLRNESGFSTPINLSIHSSKGSIASFDNTIDGDTIPYHPESLDALDGFIEDTGATWTFTWSDLEPLTVYEVYVFGLTDEEGGNSVQIVGDGPAITFDQPLTSNALGVNSEPGSRLRQLVEYAKMLPSSENGTITITVTADDEESAQALAGLAIRPGTLGSVRGQKWNDLNGDGIKDPGEEGLQGWTIFLDENGNGELDASFQQTVASEDVPQVLNDLTTVKSELFFQGVRSIFDVNITLDITHAFAADLNAYLISPAGTRVKLFSDVGGFNDDFDNVTFDDEASTAISTSLAPFSGTFRPEETIDQIELTTFPGLESVLSAFDGEDANGMWILEIKDDAPVDDGVLNSWSLTISGNEPSTTTDVEGNYIFENLIPGVYRVAEVVQSGGQSNTGITTKQSVDVPKNIQDLATVTSNLVVQNVGSIVDADVTLDITHTFVEDLTVVLISPSGTRVELFSAVGQGFDNFTNTVLDDEAPTPILSGAAPFTGRFRPERPLSAFDGQNADGTWILEITDSFPFDQGVLNSWSLTFTSSTQANWAQTFAPPPVTVSSGARIQNVDFGNWIRDVEIVRASIGGQKFNDLDGDGEKDGGEPGLEGWTIFLDGNNNGHLDLDAMVTADAVNVPLDITDFDTITSEILFNGLSSILDINVTLDITHSFAGDLDVYLISPSGTQVELFTDVGGQFNDFQNTTLDDQAETSILTAVAPFSGSFRAEGLLSDFAGEDPNGFWKLLIRDTTAADEGTLNSWSLTIMGTERSTTTDESGNYQFLDLLPNDYVLREVQQAGWMQTLAPASPMTLDEEQQITNADFGNTAALAGDYNGNNVVDMADVIVWRKTEGQNVTPFSGADGDGDGIIGQGDYDLWRMNYGMTIAPGSGSALAAAAATADAAPATTASDAGAGARPASKVRIVAGSGGSASKSADATTRSDAPALADRGDAVSGHGSIARHRPIGRVQLTSQASNDAALIDWATRSSASVDRTLPSDLWTNDRSDDFDIEDQGALDSAFESFEAVVS
jgi:subtilisin-like proprotein convertase family protein